MALIAVGAGWKNDQSYAQSDGTCGNDVVDSGEQCDDGNTNDGDGCSSVCVSEECGNGVTDLSEQCDDGNEIGGDGCGMLCTIEFCGDQIVQSPETCDDGNQFAGDGCSGSCKTESSNFLKADLVPGKTPSADPAPKSPPPPPPLPPRVIEVLVKAAEANTFLRSEEGEKYIKHLDKEDKTIVKDLLRTIRDGKALTPGQQEVADRIANDLGYAKYIRRDQTFDEIERLTSTVISQGVLSEKALDQARLTGDPTAIIEELSRVVTQLSPEELRKGTIDLLDELQSQGVIIEGLSQTDAAQIIGESDQPIAMFTAIVELKEKVEPLATKDIEATYQQVRNSADTLLAALPVLEREYGIDRGKVEAQITALKKAADGATPQQAKAVATEINKLLVTVQRDSKIRIKDLEAPDEQAAREYFHRFSAAFEQPLLTAALTPGDPEPDVAQPGELLRLTELVARQAPIAQRKAFAGENLAEQKAALQNFIRTQPRIAAMRSLLQQDGNPLLGDKEAEFFDNVDRIGEANDPFTPCDDSILEATQCAREHINWLEGAVRSRSMMSRVGGYFEDLGAVEWFTNAFSDQQ